MPNEMTSQVEIMDSEILRIEKVLEALNALQGKGGVNLEAFRKEAIERFAGIGFKIEVKVYTTNEEGVYAFDLEIVDRLEGQFDPDQQVHEVTNDILGTGDTGVINTAMSKGGLHLIKGGAHSHSH